MSWHQPAMDVSTAALHAPSGAPTAPHGILSTGGYMTGFDPNAPSAESDSSILTEQRAQLTGRELQQLLSVAHQSLDEAQER